MMNAFGGPCLVLPSISLPLWLWLFNCYPLPFSIYYFCPVHFVHSRGDFFPLSVSPLGTGYALQRKTLWLRMNLSIRKRTKRFTSYSFILREELKIKIHIIFLPAFLFSSFLHKLPLLPITWILEVIKVGDFQI